MTELQGPSTLLRLRRSHGKRFREERANEMARQGVRYPVVEGHVVADPKTCKPVPKDGKTIGEILVRGNTVMLGYLKDPKATAAAFAGGWMHTGDLAVWHPSQLRRDQGSQEGHHHLRRGEHLVGGGGDRALQAPRDPARRGGCATGREVGRDAVRLHPAEARRAAPPRRSTSTGAARTSRASRFRRRWCSGRCRRPRPARSRNSSCASARRVFDAELAQGGDFPGAVLGIHGPRRLQARAGAHLRRRELDVRRARGGDPGRRATTSARSSASARWSCAARPNGRRSRVLENRCAHRGVQFCQRAPRQRGARDHVPVPPVDLRPEGRADRRAVPPRREEAGRHAGGLRHRRARPAPAERHGQRNGVDLRLVRPRPRAVRGLPRRDACSRSSTACSTAASSTMLGYPRQLMPANWKLMFENIKDPYHASLLHVFLVTFGLFRADEPSAHGDGRDRAPRRALIASRRAAGEDRGQRRDALASTRTSKLHDPRLLAPGARVPRVRHGGDADAVAEPHRPAAVEHARHAPARHARPRARSSSRGPSSATRTTTTAMTRRRLRQANLMGAGGLRVGRRQRGDESLAEGRRGRPR